MLASDQCLYAPQNGSERGQACDLRFCRFSNLTARESQSWNGQTDDFDSAAYTNNRRSGWGYDADGRNTTIDTRTNQFDAVGQQTFMTAQQVLWNGNHVTVNQASGYDGNGTSIQDVSSGVTTYYLRSSVLSGAVIDEINSSGQKNVGYVYSPGGQLLATQRPNNPDMVTWKHNTPAGTSEYTMNTYIPAIGRTEFDPLGADVSLTAPEDPPPSEGSGDVGAGHFGGIMDARWSDFFNISGGCTMDRMAVSCSMAMSALNAGAAEICPNNDCSLRSVTINLTYRNGDQRTIHGLIQPGILPDGFNQTWTGRGAAGAATAWNSGVLSGGSFQGGVQSLIDNWIDLDRPAESRRFAHAPQNTQVVPLPNLRNGLQDLLKKGDGDCGRYVQKLLDTAAKLFPQNPLQGKNVMDLFEKISKQGNYQVDARFWNTVSGDISNNSATVHLSPWNTYGAPSAYQIDSANRNYIYGALHETLHLAGKGWLLDNQLAEAAYSIAGKKLPDIPKDDFKAWSTAFDNELMKHCPK